MMVLRIVKEEMIALLHDKWPLCLIFGANSPQNRLYNFAIRCVMRLYISTCFASWFVEFIELGFALWFLELIELGFASSDINR